MKFNKLDLGLTLKLEMVQKIRNKHLLESIEDETKLRTN